jgi:putative ABC transport system substrate-binding protein
MRRREFIRLVGGASVIWPLGSLAQQSTLPVIGFLSSASAAGYAHRVKAFKEGLRQLGFVEGQNFSVEYRWAEDQNDQLPNLAADLVEKQVAIIVAAGGSQAALAAKSATKTIPVLFVHGGDPVQLGLVASLSRPGGNVTGVTNITVETAQKRFELLRELSPKIHSFALLVHSKNPNRKTYLKDVDAAAKALGVEADVEEITKKSDFDSAFAALAQKRVGGVVITGDPIFTDHQEHLVELAKLHEIPAIYPYREFALIGGLMSYGPNVIETMRQVGLYAGRLLSGVKPADLPVVRTTKIELVINQKTVRSLGLEIPLSMLMRVDEVVE